MAAKDDGTPVRKMTDSPNSPMSPDSPASPDSPNSPTNPDSPNSPTFPDSPDFPDITNLTYEQARDELISIVAQLEGGQIGLEESMTLWQRGEALATRCSAWLDGAEAKLTTGRSAPG